MPKHRLSWSPRCSRRNRRPSRRRCRRRGPVRTRKRPGQGVWCGRARRCRAHLFTYPRPARSASRQRRSPRPHVDWPRPATRSSSPQVVEPMPSTSGHRSGAPLPPTALPPPPPRRRAVGRTGANTPCLAGAPMPHPPTGRTLLTAPLRMGRPAPHPASEERTAPRTSHRSGVRGTRCQLPVRPVAVVPLARTSTWTTRCGSCDQRPPRQLRAAGRHRASRPTSSTPPQRPIRPAPPRRDTGPPRDGPMPETTMNPSSKRVPRITGHRLARRTSKKPSRHRDISLPLTAPRLPRRPALHPTRSKSRKRRNQRPRNEPASPTTPHPSCRTPGAAHRSKPQTTTYSSKKPTIVRRSRCGTTPRSAPQLPRRPASQTTPRPVQCPRTFRSPSRPPTSPGDRASSHVSEEPSPRPPTDTMRRPWSRPTVRPIPQPVTSPTPHLRLRPITRISPGG